VIGVHVIDNIAFVIDQISAGTDIELEGITVNLMDIAKSADQMSAFDMHFIYMKIECQQIGRIRVSGAEPVARTSLFGYQCCSGDGCPGLG